MHTSCTCTLLSREAPGRHLKPRRAQPTHPTRGTNRTSPHYLLPRNIVTGARVNARGKVIVPFLSKLNKRIPSQHVAVVEAVSYSGYAAVYVASLAAMHRVGADASSGGALRIYRWKRRGGSHAPHDRNATKHVELQRNSSSLSHLTWLPAHRSCVFVCGRLSRSSDSSDKSLTPGPSRLDVDASCAGGSQLRRCRHTCGQLPRFCTRTRWVGRRRSALRYRGDASDDQGDSVHEDDGRVGRHQQGRHP